MNKKILLIFVLISLVLLSSLVFAKEYKDMTDEEKISYLDEYGVTNVGDIEETGVIGNVIIVNKTTATLTNKKSANVLLDGADVDVTSYSSILKLGKKGATIEAKNGRFYIDSAKHLEVIDGNLVFKGAILNGKKYSKFNEDYLHGKNFDINYNKEKQEFELFTNGGYIDIGSNSKYSGEIILGEKGGKVRTEDSYLAFTSKQKIGIKDGNFISFKDAEGEKGEKPSMLFGVPIVGHIAKLEGRNIFFDKEILIDSLTYIPEGKEQIVCNIPNKRFNSGNSYVTVEDKEGFIGKFKGGFQKTENLFVLHGSEDNPSEFVNPKGSLFSVTSSTDLCNTAVCDRENSYIQYNGDLSVSAKNKNKVRVESKDGVYGKVFVDKIGDDSNVNLFLTEDNKNKMMIMFSEHDLMFKGDHKSLKTGVSHIYKGQSDSDYFWTMNKGRIYSVRSEISRQFLSQTKDKNLASFMISAFADKLPAETKVELEVRKHDPWIEEYLENDYSNEDREGFVRFAITSEEEIEQKQEFGRTESAASYNMEDEVIYLPYHLNEQTIDAIDHELFHSLFDNFDEKGILHSDEFSGPDLDEIEEFCTEKISDERFEKVKQRLRSRQEMGETGKLIIKSLGEQAPKYGSAQKSINRLNRFFKDNTDVESFLDEDFNKEELEKLNEEHNEYAKKFNDYYTACLSFGTELETMDPSEVELDYIIQSKTELKDYYDDLMTYSDLNKRTQQYEDYSAEVYIKADTRKFELQIKELKKDAESDDKEIREGAKRMIREFTAVRERLGGDLIQQEFRTPNPTNFESTIQSALFVRGLETQSYYIDQILNDPNEVMARTVDSLYSLYYGPVQQNSFPLSEKDLGFLEKFTYKDQPMFRKGVEKYRLGLEMIKDGIPSEQVKQELEYATSYTYKGETYDWPDAQVTIKGNIGTE